MEASFTLARMKAFERIKPLIEDAYNVATVRMAMKAGRAKSASWADMRAEMMSLLASFQRTCIAQRSSKAMYNVAVQYTMLRPLGGKAAEIAMLVIFFDLLCHIG